MRIVCCFLCDYLTEMCTRITKTIILKSPDSNKVREVIVTPVVLPNSEMKMLPSFNQMEYSFADRLNRKRRLEHLSLEEKIMRKKLKNREAAQTSRDRKKARLEQLEETVKRLQEENDVLHEEVRSLKNDRESLTKENSELREELWSLRVGSANLGPAVSFVSPLPQGIVAPLTLHLYLLLVHVQYFLKIGTGLTQLHPHQTWNSLKNLQILSLLRLLNLRNLKTEIQPWWGRKQRAWNPLGIVKKKHFSLLVSA